MAYRIVAVLLTASDC